MSARISTTNSTVTNLLPNQSFFGTKDIVGEFTKCGVSIFADQEIYLLVTQSQNGVSADKLDVYTIPASTAPPPFTEFASPRISVEMSHKYVTITARNTSATTATTFCRIQTQIYNEGFLTHTHDNVKLWGTTADGVHKAVLTNEDGALIVSGGGGDASLWATFPAVDNVDMDGKALGNVDVISSRVNENLLIATGSGQLDFKTATNTLQQNTMSYSVLGNLTFSDGEQNINNLLGVTHSQGFTLTQNGGGVITFEDGTTQSTASGGGGGGGNFSTPSNQNLDMNGNNITNINLLGSVENQYINMNSGIAFTPTSGSYINNVSNIVGNNVGNDPYLEISNLTSISTPSSTGLQVNVAGGVSFFNGTNLSMNDGLINGVSSLYFSDLTDQTTAYQNPFQTQLDMNGQNIIRTTQIFGNSDMTFTAGMTNASEDSSISLSNNGYRVAGTYSQLFLKPTGVELNTGDLTASTDYKATLDTAGVFSAPQFKVSSNIYVPYGLDMNNKDIINVSNIISAPQSNTNITTLDADSQISLVANNSGIGGTSNLNVSPAGITLNTRITGTEDTASATFLPLLGTFNAPFFVAQGFQPSVGTFQKGYVDTPKVTNVERIEFSNSTVQTTAYTGADVRDITSTDDSITVSRIGNVVNLAVTSPYTLPVATTTVLGGVKPDGTTITATAGGVISATAQGITSNTFYVNDNVNNINDVLPLMGSGDIAIVSAGTFGQATDITWNVPASGLSGSVAPAPLSFLTTANASRFTVTATQVRIANIKFQLPVFLSGNNCVVDNCDIDSAITIGTNVTGFITLNNCEFGNTPVITVASTFTNILYFINCNFGGATLTLSQASASQVIFNNCAGFTTYPANATYVGINVLSAGTAQLSTNDLKSVSGTLRLTSGLNVNSQAFTNVGTMAPVTNGQISFTNGLNIPSGSLNMRFNNIFNAGTITWTTGLTTIASASASRNLYTVSIPAFVSGANADFVMNDLGVFSTKSVTLTTGGILTYPDATTQNTAYKNLDVQTITNTDGMLTITAPTTHGVTIQSAMKKGKATLSGGSYVIFDNTVTANCVCVVTYADSSPINGVLCAKVTAGTGIIIESTLVGDFSPFFYMYFI